MTADGSDLVWDTTTDKHCCSEMIGRIDRAISAVTCYRDGTRPKEDDAPDIADDEVITTILRVLEEAKELRET